MTDFKPTKLELSLILGLLLAMVLSPIMAFGKEAATLQDQVLRLHIMANSDSDHDQQLKLAVRDALLNQYDLLLTAQSLDQATDLAAQSIADIQRIANDTLAALGSDQAATAQLVQMYFGTRVYQSDQYEDFTMPAGEYGTVQITIGSGSGQNWWCVMFPPMCVDVASKQVESEPIAQTQQQIYDLQQHKQYKMAFATVEFIEKAVDYFKK